MTFNYTKNGVLQGSMLGHPLLYLCMQTTLLLMISLYFVVCERIELSDDERLEKMIHMTYADCYICHIFKGLFTFAFIMINILHLSTYSVILQQYQNAAVIPVCWYALIFLYACY